VTGFITVFRLRHQDNPEDVHDCTLSLPVDNRDCIQGNVDADVVLVFYGNYQCPRSAQAYTVIRAVMQTVQPQHELCLVFRHFPQPHCYPHAQRAAEAAEAAGSQGEFWRMHERLFQHEHAFDNGNMAEYAIDIGLDGIPSGAIRIYSRR
jgi:protein-disulfide isomerase